VAARFGVWFGLLGPLQVRCDGADIRVSAPRHRVLLAVLLCRPNRVVGLDELAYAMWDGHPPAGAETTVRSYVMRLRRVLGAAAIRIETASPGYRIALDPSAELDTFLFTARCQAADTLARVGDWGATASALDEALALWRGTPLQDVPSETLSRDELPAWLERRSQAVELRLEAAIELGRAAEAVIELRRLAAEHPLRERTSALLMTALAACDRRSEALEIFRDLRRVLVEEVGIEPGMELQELHQRILNGSQSPAAGSGATVPAHSPEHRPYPVPRTLPAGIGDFTGHEEHVDALVSCLRTDPAGGSRAVRIVSIAGMGGAGKTTLAVHAAHRVSSDFPDGQLYADLRGSAPVPVPPATVLSRFLRQLGAEPDALPADDEERGALYRSLLAQRRVLVLLDDARDAAQVRPLLPANPDCAVLVTMRNRVTGLPGAMHLDLEGLPREAAHRMLSRIIGADRVAAEPAAVSDVLAACADLPLAVRLIGARLASRPSWRVQYIASRLRAQRSRLDELSYADQDVRATFEMSYSALDTPDAAAVPAARALCLLGLWPGQDIGLTAAASLLGAPVHQAERVLEYLVDSYLVQSPQPGRYSLHDLLRDFAFERAEQDLAAADRRAAITRVITWYVRAAAAMNATLSPANRQIHPAVVPDLTPPPDLSTVPDALDWGESEHANLCDATGLAAASGLWELAWQLPTASMSFFQRQRHLRSWISTHEIALSSTQQAADEKTEAIVRNNLAIALLTAGRHVEAIDHLKVTVAIHSSFDDAALVASALINMGVAAMEAGFPDQAIGYLSQAVAYYQASGSASSEAAARTNIGYIHLLLGQPAEAIQESAAAIRLYRLAPSVSWGLAEVLDNISQAYLLAGSSEQALSHARDAVSVRRQLCDRPGLAEGLRHLGELLADTNRTGARTAWSEAAVILRELDDPRAAEVEALLGTRRRS
jgi:DNA-binding SARP family transcriptional activator/tetratricopeptide (TPR) repeat protein